MKSVVRMLGAALLVGCAGWLMPAAGWAQEEQQQSLGDVARQEKAKKPPKTLSNEDLPQGTAASGSESAPAASSSDSAKTEEQGEAAASEGGESAAAPGAEGSQSKAQQAEQAKTELEALKHDESAYENGIKRLQEKLANETDPDRRELYSNAIQHAQEKMEKNKQDLAAKEKELADKEAAAKEEEQNQQQAQPPQ